jgi:hypothetical protein
LTLRANRGGERQSAGKNEEHRCFPLHEQILLNRFRPNNCQAGKLDPAGFDGA